jgi:hypothetical protein
MTDDKPVWDEAFGARLLGCVVLIGITRLSADGESSESFHGIVEQADADGIDLRLQGSRAGETFFIPPEPKAFFPAPPGWYRLHPSGDLVENPDYTTTWTINPGDGG